MAPGKFDRFMVDVHVGTSRKLRRLTAVERLCHIAGVLAIAAQAPIRGRLLVGNEEATDEDYAETAGVSVGVARSTAEKLRAIGVIVPDEENHCERIHDWEHYNPEPKRDDTAAERMRRYRERRNDRNDSPVTVRNAVTVTAGREEKGREEEAKASSSGAQRQDREREKASNEDRANCRLFAELVRGRNPKAKIPKAGREVGWLRDMRLLREADANTAADIERLIRWLFTDPCRDAVFWGTTIAAPSGLREHFPTIWAKMTAQTTLRAVPAVESSADYLARTGAA